MIPQPSIPGAIPLAVRSPIFAFTSGLTFHQLVDNSQEMGRLLLSRRQEIRLPPQEQLFLASYSDFYHLVAIVEEESPDTAAMAPIFAAMAAASPRMDLRFVLSDDDFSLLNQIVDELDLDDEEELDLPLLIFLDEEWKYQTHWGPRPDAADEKLEAWLSQNGAYEGLSDKEEEETLTAAEEQQLARLTGDLLQQTRFWYNSELTQTVIVEICALLQELLEDEADENDDE